MFSSITMKALSTTCLAIILFAACTQKKPDPLKTVAAAPAITDSTHLPLPHATKSPKVICKIVNWPKGATPTAPAGFKVNLYAGKLNTPCNIYTGPNHDIFVAQANSVRPSANNIILLRDVNRNGHPKNMGVFLKGVHQPYGMLIMGNWFYVAATDCLWRFPYRAGQTRITGKAQKILVLPSGGYNNHWARNIIATEDGQGIYIAVGSGTNDAEHGMKVERRRADILKIDAEGNGETVYASGLRNPAGMAINPVTKQLWTAVNERDDLGDNLVPDYLTSVKPDGFYGWPYAYYGPHPDPNHKGEHPDKVKKTIVPDVNLGSHTASLGLAFYTGNAFPQRYINGAFVGQHGSWNSSKLVGYKVVFVPFTADDKPGKPEDFLTGFIADEQKHEVHGRPMGVAISQDGALLVADEAAGKIWRVTAVK